MSLENTGQLLGGNAVTVVAHDQHVSLLVGMRAQPHVATVVRMPDGIGHQIAEHNRDLFGVQLDR